MKTRKDADKERELLEWVSTQTPASRVHNFKLVQVIQVLARAETRRRNERR